MWKKSTQLSDKLRRELELEQLLTRLEENDLTLTSIELSQINNERVQALAEALKVNHTLTSIELSQINNERVHALAEALKVNHTLTSIVLKGTGIGYVAGQALAEALKVNGTLTSFVLIVRKETRISSAVAQALAEALKVNRTLTSFSLYHNQLGDEGVQALAEALKVNRTLTSINLSKIRDKGVQALAEALKVNGTLTSIDLWYNEIGDDGAQSKREIKEIITRNRSEYTAHYPLHAAVLFGYGKRDKQAKVISLLNVGHNPQSQDNVGRTVLDIARQKGYVTTTKLLESQQVSSAGPSGVHTPEQRRKERQPREPERLRNLCILTIAEHLAVLEDKEKDFFDKGTVLPWEIYSTSMFSPNLKEEIKRGNTSIKKELDKKQQPSAGFVIIRQQNPSKNAINTERVQSTVSLSVHGSEMPINTIEILLVEKRWSTAFRALIHWIYGGWEGKDMSYNYWNLNHEERKIIQKTTLEKLEKNKQIPAGWKEKKVEGGGDRLKNLQLMFQEKRIWSSYFRCLICYIFGKYESYNSLVRNGKKLSFEERNILETASTDTLVANRKIPKPWRTNYIWQLKKANNCADRFQHLKDVLSTLTQNKENKDTYWSLPKGTIDRQEYSCSGPLYMKAAYRELKEETNLISNQVELINIPEDFDITKVQSSSREGAQLTKKDDSTLKHTFTTKEGKYTDSYFVFAKLTGEFKLFEDPDNPEIKSVRFVPVFERKQIGDHIWTSLPKAIQETLEVFQKNYTKQKKIEEKQNVHGPRVTSTLESVQPTVSNISIRGLQYQSLPGDGHCLYRAVTYYLTSGEDIGFLRNIIAANIEHDIDRYREFIALPNERTIEEYLTDIKGRNAWAGDLEINVLMRLLDRPIIIIGPDQRIRNQQQIAEFQGDPIFVYYNGVNHYDALLLDGTLEAGYILTSLMQLPEHSQAAQHEQLPHTASALQQQGLFGSGVGSMDDVGEAPAVNVPH